MDSATRTTSGSLLRRSFWLPAATLLGIEFYAAQFDGWGAWSTAPLFLVPLSLGLIVGLVAPREVWSEAQSHRIRWSTLLFLAIALVPLAWLPVRRHFF